MHKILLSCVAFLTLAGLCTAAVPTPTPTPPPLTLPAPHVSAFSSAVLANGPECYYQMEQEVWTYNYCWGVPSTVNPVTFWTLQTMGGGSSTLDYGCPLGNVTSGINLALSLNSVYMNAVGASTIGFSTSTPFSAVVWVKVITSSSNPIILSGSSTSPGDGSVDMTTLGAHSTKGWALYAEDSLVGVGNLAFLWTDATANRRKWVTSRNVMDEAWHCLGFIYDGAGNVTLFDNGQPLDATVTNTGAGMPTLTAAQITVMEVGNCYGGVNQLNGLFDELAVFKGAHQLTAQKVADLYTTAALPTPTPAGMLVEDDFTSRTRAVAAPGVATLPFRGCFLSFGDPRPAGANDQQKISNQAAKLASVTSQLKQMSGEGFNVAIWSGTSELWPPGNQAMLRLSQYPEARELSAADAELSISFVKSVFAMAKQLGMDNYLYPLHLYYTPAFASAHSLAASGTRNTLTESYLKAVYTEMVQTYNDLDGFFGPIGEAVPGVRSTLFRNAIAPGLKQAGRKARFVAHQWQIPIKEYLRDIAPSDVYDNTWLGYHAYTCEQIIDTAPCPGLVGWANATGLPTVAVIYPANIQNFPFNSPRFAWETCHNMKKTENVTGFLCWQQLPIPALSSLWRKALLRYAKTNEPYSDDPWIELLTRQFGDAQAAKHLLAAFNTSAWIIPKFYQLVYVPNDQSPRELQFPYLYTTRSAWAYSASTWTTGQVASPDPLVPIYIYAEKVSQNPNLYRNNNGSDPALNGGGQTWLWGVEEGYDVLPPMHMQEIRNLADQALQSAQLALPLVKTNLDEATRIRDFMQAYQYLVIYYQNKVNAAVAAIIYSKTRKAADRATAMSLAQQALTSWQTFYDFLKTKLVAPMSTVYGRQFAHNAAGGKTLDQLAADEQSDYNNIASIFGWP